MTVYELHVARYHVMAAKRKLLKIDNKCEPMPTAEYLLLDKAINSLSETVESIMEMIAMQSAKKGKGNE